MPDTGLPLSKRVGQVLWLVLLFPFLLIGGLIRSVGHAAKRSGYSDK